MENIKSLKMWLLVTSFLGLCVICFVFTFSPWTCALYLRERLGDVPSHLCAEGASTVSLVHRRVSLRLWRRREMR